MQETITTATAGWDEETVVMMITMMMQELLLRRRRCWLDECCSIACRQWILKEGMWEEAVLMLAVRRKRIPCRPQPCCLRHLC
jgi:hypothetical protein